ncbi:MAG: DHHW family protein [Lachnospiraceae bacterium]
MEKKHYSKCAAVLFLVLVFGFTGATFAAPKRTFSENENRLLASMPEFSWEALFDGKFTADYETYITDQFFFRDQWIQLKTLSEMALNKQDINGVYIGKDGYLIERHEDSEIDFELLEKSLNRLVEFTEKYAKKLGAEHVKIMLVPTASEILTDKLPPFATGFDQNGMLDSLYERLPEGTALDVRDILKEHADEYIYYKTDHHWTTLGAFYAYQVWAAAMGFEVPVLDEVTQTPVSEEFHGTVYSKLNLDLSKDTMYRFDLPNAPSKVEVTLDMMDKMDSMYNEKYLSMKDKYSYYLDGNHGLTEIASNSEGKGTLLIIKDSYSHCFAPFTASNYEKVYLVDFRYFNMPISQFIAQYRVTDILVLYNAVTFATDTHSGAFVR